MSGTSGARARCAAFHFRFDGFAGHSIVDLLQVSRVVSVLCAGERQGEACAWRAPGRVSSQNIYSRELRWMLGEKRMARGPAGGMLGFIDEDGVADGELEFSMACEPAGEVPEPLVRVPAPVESEDPVRVLTRLRYYGLCMAASPPNRPAARDIFGAFGDR